MKESDVKNISLTYFPEEILRKKTNPISLENDYSSLIGKMKKIMNAKKGVGLASPQVGLDWQLFLTQEFDKDSLRVFINPTITAFSEEKELREEGCLSVPEVYANVPRSLEIDVHYFNEKGKEIKSSFNGFLARIIQHEYDHLQGILFFDHLSPSLKRKLLREYFASLKTLSKKNRG